MTRTRSVLSLFVILLVIIVVTTIWRATMRERATEADYPPEGLFVTVEGVKLHAVVRGKGPDLVLLHGASGSVRDLSFGFIDALAARYRVIAIDRPGLGWSEPGPGTDHISAQARLLREAAAELGATRPIIFGHSYGGAVALAWAVDAPDSVAALVLASAVSHPWDGDVPFLYKVAANPVAGPLTVTGISAWVPEGYVTDQVNAVFLPQTVPPGYDEHFGPMMSARAAAFRANSEQRVTLKEDVRAQVAQYPAIAVPVEILHGDSDPVVYASVHSEPLAREVPGARLTILPGVGHMPQHTARPAVIAAIDRAAARAGLLPPPAP